jgi:hypothetical protein
MKSPKAPKTLSLSEANLDAWSELAFQIHDGDFCENHHMEAIKTLGSVAEKVAPLIDILAFAGLLDVFVGTLDEARKVINSEWPKGSNPKKVQISLTPTGACMNGPVLQLDVQS